MREIKCSKCGHWTTNSKTHCSNCNQSFFEKEEAEIEIRKKTEFEPMNLPLIDINEDDHFPLKIAKYVIRFHQVVFFSIISYIAWIITMVAA